MAKQQKITKEKQEEVPQKKSSCKIKKCNIC